MNIIKIMLGHKKLTAVIVAILVAFSSEFGLNIPEETITKVIQALMVYIGGQAFADWGKEAVKEANKNGG
jgi:hypothetical protein